MNFCKRRREERREAIRLERERQRRKEREEFTESSVYSSDDNGSDSDVAAPANKGQYSPSDSLKLSPSAQAVSLCCVALEGRFFAPPSNYNAPPQNDQDRPPAISAPNPVASRAETGDEAYARRVALTQGMAYNPPTLVPAAPEESSGSHPSSVPSDPPQVGFSGVSVAEAQARAKSIAERLQTLRAENEQASPPVLPAGPAMPPTKSIPTLEEAQAKARSIAAKLASLSGGGAASAPGIVPAPASTAEQSTSSNVETSTTEPVSKALVVSLFKHLHVLLCDVSSLSALHRCSSF